MIEGTHTLTVTTSVAPTEFEARLEAQVRQHLGGLTTADAVDEANGDVLDAYIDSAVGQELERIDARTLRHQQTLRQQLTSLATERAQAEAQRAADAEQASAQARQVLALRAGITGGAGGAGLVEAGGPIDPVRLRAFAAMRRSVLERERDAATGGRFTRSAAHLRLRRDAAARRVVARERILDARRARLEGAEHELAGALRRFRGVDHTPPSQPATTSTTFTASTTSTTVALVAEGEAQDAQT